MAKSGAVWGIDVGQCALKAMRCRIGDSPDVVVADAFDYIEYPKILSQPEAEPAELIHEALTQFLSRNTVKGDRVAISVAGQSGLARFIKLPPVESKKIPDIVKYEAKQQIPFALEDVVWDYQQMAGGSVEEGFALETEVGLFAMKRDQVKRALEPFKKTGIEVDIVQLTPLALYNFVAFDQMRDLPPPEEYDPENPPDSIVLLSLGTDTTDLVVTNGYRVWQRSVPLGGNHFTRALTKELKLTFAKAEHLKRNATQAEDPKAVFQAMRPVFNDLLTEIQRSIGYYQNIDRTAKLGKVIVLGNAMKLPGLQRYLSQNLGYEVVRLDSYQALSGPGVVDAPAFKENMLSFATCYGLALQGLTDTKIYTNLVPRELIQERMIREKKPWAVGAAAVLLLGFLLSQFGAWRQANSANLETFQQAISQADSVNSTANSHTSAFNSAKSQFEQTKSVGQGLVQNVEGRRLWIELLKAINLCIPRDPDGIAEDRPIERRDEVHITSVECRKVESVQQWFQTVQPWYIPPKVEEPEPAPAAEGEAENVNAPPQPLPPAQPAAPTPHAGEGWVFTLTAYHYHNPADPRALVGATYVRERLIKNLHQERITLPNGEEFPVGELGIALPVLIDPKTAVPVKLIDESKVDRDGKHPEIALQRFDFVVEFSWVETPPSERQQPGDDAAGDQAINGF